MLQGRIKMKEYEYSYKVKDIKPFLEFCKDNKYEEINILEQKKNII